MALTILPSTLRFGSGESETLTAPNFTAVFGLRGNDTLRSSGDIAALYGGEGNDHYIADGWITEIVDQSGESDSLHVSGHADDYLGAILGGSHLVLVNQWTGATTITLDWMGAGRIESFSDDYGTTYDADQVQRMIMNEGYGNVGYEELLDFAAIQDMTTSDFQDLTQIETQLGRLDWDGVFRALGDSDLNRSDEVAEAIRDVLLPSLSEEARNLWYESGYDDAARNSRFEGLTDNVEAATRPAAESVGLLYRAALDRIPDSGGFDYWLEQAFDGLEFSEMAARFLDSDEFRSRFDVANDSDFLDSLYLNVLDRTADAPGKTYWLGAMEDGRSRADVLTGFALSPENREGADWLAGLERATDGDWSIA